MEGFHCVVCGQIIENNHVCPPRVVAGREAANRVAINREVFFEYETPKISDNMRLVIGLGILESRE